MKKIISTALVCLLLFTSMVTAFGANGYNVNKIDSYIGKLVADPNVWYQKNANTAYNPYVKRYNTNRQCVGYVYARLEDKLRISPDFSSGPGAKDIPRNAPNGAIRTSYTTGQTYKIEVYKNDNGSHITANSWVSFGATSKNKYGHVVYVEEVIGNNIYYTEGGWGYGAVGTGTAGYLKKATKSKFLSKKGGYVGTVVFRPQGTTVKTEQTTTAPASTLKIDLTSYPTSINQGSSYGLRGTISSNYTITKVNGYIINSSGKTVQSTTDTPNSTSMNIRYGNVNQNLLFNKLEAGTYTLKITAKDSKKTVEVSKQFTVVGKNTKKESTLKIDLTSYPTTLKKGKMYGLRGTISSNYNITKVNGYIINSSGKTVQSTTDTPNSTSMNIRYANVNQNLLFDKLGVGSYTLKITATDSSGKTVSVSKNFKVTK